MMWLVQACLISTALSLAGLSIDKFLLPHQARWIRQKLRKFWNNVRYQKIPDVPTYVVNAGLKKTEVFIGRKGNIRWQVAIFLSFWVTTLSLFLGIGYSKLFLQALATNWVGDHSTFFLSLPTDILERIIGIYGYFLILLYILNFFGDFLTVAITIFLLKKFVYSESIIRYLYISLDIVLAILLSLLIYIPAAYLNSNSMTNRYLLERTQKTIDRLAPEELRELLLLAKKQEAETLSHAENIRLAHLLNNAYEVGGGKSFGPADYWDEYKIFFSKGASRNIDIILIANTTMIPTILYLISVAGLAFLVFCYKFMRFFLVQIVRLSIQDEKKSVFYYTFTLLGIVNLFASLTLKLVGSDL